MVADLQPRIHPVREAEATRRTATAYVITILEVALTHIDRTNCPATQSAIAISRRLCGKRIKAKPSLASPRHCEARRIERYGGKTHAWRGSSGSCFAAILTPIQHGVSAAFAVSGGE